jgi:hypothetical protein
VAGHITKRREIHAKYVQQKKKSLIASVLRVRRPERPHKYAGGGARLKEFGF